MHALSKVFNGCGQLYQNEIILCRVRSSFSRIRSRHRSLREEPVTREVSDLESDLESEIYDESVAAMSETSDTNRRVSVIPDSTASYSWPEVQVVAGFQYFGKKGGESLVSTALATGVWRNYTHHDVLLTNHYKYNIYIYI